MVKRRWFKRTQNFYGAIVVTLPSKDYFQVGSRTHYISGLDEKVLTGPGYDEITETEAIKAIGRSYRGFRRWHEGLIIAMELCGKLD